MSFRNLGLSEPFLRAVAAEDCATPTPIQSHAIPRFLAGRDDDVRERLTGDRTEVTDRQTTRSFSSCQRRSRGILS
jgi:hypothetical protein